jgi:DNA-binding transcriptional ArsR family regulator
MIAQHDEEFEVAKIAAAIGEPARTRMLYCLLDGCYRTSTELAIVADVSPSTASVHLQRLMAEDLIKVKAQGKHRYYSLGGANTARALESLSVLAGKPRKKFVPNTPNELRFARTCYDHMAGTAAVLLHNRFLEAGWLAPVSSGRSADYYLTSDGIELFSSLGIETADLHRLRRRFAFGCIDWSERRPHLGGALGSAFLQTAMKRKWATRELDSRALEITSYGKREMLKRFGVRLG